MSLEQPSISRVHQVYQESNRIFHRSRPPHHHHASSANSILHTAIANDTLVLRMMRQTSRLPNNEDVVESSSPIVLPGSVEPASSSATATVVDSLLELLRALRNGDASVHQVQLQSLVTAGTAANNNKWSLPSQYLQALLEAVAAHAHVTRLLLAKTGLKDDLASSLALCFSSSSSSGSCCCFNLVDVDLSKNSLGDASCIAIAQALEDSSSSTSTSSASSSIRRLNLESNQIGDTGLQLLCPAVARHSQISILKLGRNAFGLPGIQAIATHLLLSGRGTTNGASEASSPVTCLDLRGNRLGPAGIQLLATSLHCSASSLSPQSTVRACPSTFHLENGDAATTPSSSSSPPTFNDALYCCEACPPLQYLYLSRNNVDNEAVSCLADTLRHNTRLRLLDLRYNSFDDAGALALVDALKVNHTFTKVKLRHVAALSEEVKQQLLDLLVMNAHGPVLARATKLAWAQRIKQQQLRSADEPESDDEAATEELCVICYDSLANCALLPCQHDNCCMPCGKRLRGHCHMCRHVIVKLFSLTPDDPTSDATHGASRTATSRGATENDESEGSNDSSAPTAAASSDAASSSATTSSSLHHASSPTSRGASRIAAFLTQRMESILSNGDDDEDEFEVEGRTGVDGGEGESGIGATADPLCLLNEDDDDENDQNEQQQERESGGEAMSHRQQIGVVEESLSSVSLSRTYCRNESNAATEEGHHEERRRTGMTTSQGDEQDDSSSSNDDDDNLQDITAAASSR